MDLKQRGGLSALRVIDFGHHIAGPFASAVLGDLGATVVKVEPLDGDPLRVFGPISFVTSNRGKLSIAIDLKNPGASAILDRALGWADVVHHNFRPGVAERLGLDAASLREERPELIVVQTSAYGASGPRSRRPGFNVAAEAAAGHLVHAAGESNPPRPNRIMQVDHGTAMIGALGTVGAVLRLLRTGQGASIYTSLYDTAVYFLSEAIRDADGTFAGVEVLDADVTGFHPAESLYEASDGWLAVAAVGDAAAQAFARVLQVTAPRTSNEWGAEQRREIGDAIRSRRVAQLVEELRAAGVWAEPCPRDAGDALLTDDVLRERGTFVAASGPDGPHTGIGFGLSPSPLESDRHGRVPDIGEDTDRVLELWGIERAERERFLQEAVAAGGEPSRAPAATRPGS